ncbi:hypothetical protein OP10G_3445 [Fimbriimonas ginsengisoli Gsoil 348]|uniref:Uncharacterized protein n=1 Tax=Fimbriimonas ginsengisoli Gsoil 348 TaxID=661478 RepID=A0A068NTD3_FIMGI|nr:hypothetical protein OP10G_3445 [Fimbriimonas ginsengisoli Gsoil 348]
MANGECFICSWHGEFDHDPGRVEAGLGELLVRCPELADAMIESTGRPSLAQRLRHFWNRVQERFMSLGFPTRRA